MAGFDAQGARAAGYNDRDIADYMGKFMSFDVAGARAAGYSDKEIVDHLEGRVSLDEAVSTTILRTRQFAVRQERWFRRDPRVQWFDVQSDPVAEVAPAVEALLV